MMTLNRYRLRHLAKQGHQGAIRAEKLLQKPDRLISLVLIGNNLVNIIASSLATVVGQRLYGNTGTAIAISSTAVTLAILIFAEIMPKTIAALRPEAVAFSSSWLLSMLLKLTSPLIYLLNAATNGLIGLFGIRARDKPPHDALTKEELRTLFNEANPLIPKPHQDMLLSVLDLEKMEVEDIMVPRSEVVGIDLDNTWEEILQQIYASTHGRVVLFRSSLDSAVGMLRIHDAYHLLLSGNKVDQEDLLKAADELYFIPQGTPLTIQLLKFQRNKERTGLVVDEYGDIKGLVTVQDILAVIVGDFFLSATPSLAEEVVIQDDATVLVDGAITIRNFNKLLGCSLPTDGARSLNGLLLEYLEDIPKAGDKVALLGYNIEILEVKNNMIKRVKMVAVPMAGDPHRGGIS